MISIHPSIKVQQLTTTLTNNKANTHMPSTNTLLPHRTTLTPTHQTPLILLHGPMSNAHSTLLSILGTIGDGT
eukprot:scaffold2735_cov75-Skeletonema_dohrnii-CCMP3373.AAC.1